MHRRLCRGGRDAGICGQARSFGGDGLDGHRFMDDASGTDAWKLVPGLSTVEHMIILGHAHVYFGRSNSSALRQGTRQAGLTACPASSMRGLVHAGSSTRDHGSIRMNEDVHLTSEPCLFCHRFTTIPSGTPGDIR